MIRSRSSTVGGAAAAAAGSNGGGDSASSEKQNLQILLNNLPTDISTLNDVELCAFLSNSLEAFDLMSAGASSDAQTLLNRNRFATTLVRCLGTVPFARVFSLFCIRDNLSATISGSGSKQQGDAAAAGTSAGGAAPPSAAAVATSDIPAKKLQRSFPASVRDIGSTKSTRRRIVLLFSLLSTKLADALPSLIPELLAAALKFFSTLPGAAHFSVTAWLKTPAVIGDAGDDSGDGAGYAPVDGGRKRQPKASTRDFAALLSSVLDVDLDSHLFRVVALLLARQQEAQFEQQQQREAAGGANKSAKAQQQQQQQQQQHGGGGQSKQGGNAAFAVLSSAAQLLLRNPCHTVLERSVPQKRWPVGAHHLSWFSVMSKFFHRSFVDAAARNLVASSNSAAAAAEGAGNGGAGDLVVARAHATLSELWRGPILRMMMSGLSNLETSARNDRTSANVARRCAAITVDALVNATRPSEIAAVTASANGSAEAVVRAASALYRQHVLSHYTGTVVYMAPPLAGVHAVAVSSAVALDRATDGAAGTVGAFVLECCTRLGQLIESRQQDDVFRLEKAGSSRFDDEDDDSNGMTRKASSSAGGRAAATGSAAPHLPRDSDHAMGDATGTEQLLGFSHMANALRCLANMCQTSDAVKAVVAQSLAPPPAPAAAAVEQDGGSKKKGQPGKKGAVAQASESPSRAVLVKLAAVCASKASRNSSAAWLLSDVLGPLAQVLGISVAVAPSSVGDNDGEDDDAVLPPVIRVPETTSSMWVSYLALVKDLVSC